jgi:hypothetical protein
MHVGPFCFLVEMFVADGNDDDEMESAYISDPEVEYLIDGSDTESDYTQ